MICDSLRMSRLVNRGVRLNFLIAKFTFECNIGCRVCVENSTPDLKEMLSMERMEKAFKDVKDLPLDLGLQGGEVMLYPEYCADIFNLWRKINKYGMTHMLSNGYWGNDPAKMEYMSKEIRPDNLGITVDKWHQEFIPIEHIQNIVDYFYDDPNIALFFFNIFSKNNPKMTQEEMGIKCDKKIVINGNPLHFYGRGENAMNRDHDDSPKWKEYNNEDIGCDNFGFSLHPDGEIVSNCPLERHGCKCGHIDTHNLGDLYEKLRRPMIKYTGKTYNMSAVCKELGIHCLDQKYEKPKPMFDAI